MTVTTESLKARLADLTEEADSIRQELKRRRRQSREARMLDGSETAKRLRHEENRRVKLAALPALEKEVAELRQTLRDNLLWEEAVPAQGMPVRMEPPEGLLGYERRLFVRKDLGRFKTLMARWVGPERDRLRAHVAGLETQKWRS